MRGHRAAPAPDEPLPNGRVGLAAGKEVHTRAVRRSHCFVRLPGA